MNVMYFFVGAAVIGALILGGIFLMMLKSGQFDDLEGQAYRILFDEDDAMVPKQRERDGGEGQTPSPPDQRNQK